MILKNFTDEKKKRQFLLNRSQMNSKGFTLVELAIVLVIVGLLVGGILQGQNLVKQARIQSQIRQFKDIQTGVLAFKSKYNCDPGRCENGVALGVGADSYLDYGINAPMRACDDTYNGGADCPSAVGERIFFVNLKNSGLISMNAANASYQMEANYPGGIITLLQKGDLNILSLLLSGKYSSGFYKPLFESQDAFNLDKKIDDGMPYTGGISATGYLDDIVDWVGQSHYGGDPVYSIGSAGVKACINTDTTPEQYNTSYTNQPICSVAMDILY